jgi:peroxiredoxin Q/BCP
MVNEGDCAPEFALPNQEGCVITLSSLRGKSVVLYFYPKDDTPGCTREACAFRDFRPELEASGAVVLGVSADSVTKHRKFADKHGLPFSLLSDPDRSVIETYGVWKEKTLYGRTSMGIERTTFVIDAEGMVAKRFSKVRVDGHAERVLEAVRAAGRDGQGSG